MTTVVGTNATVLPRTSASNGTAHWVNEYGSPDAHYWLRGAMLAEISALCHTLAAVLLRKQAHKELRRVEEEQEHQEQRSSDVWGGGPVRRRTPTVDHAAVAAVVSRQRSIEPLSSHSVGTRLALVRSGKFWASVLLRALASCMWWFAHCYAKNATIAPVFFSVSLLTGLVFSFCVWVCAMLIFAVLLARQRGCGLGCKGRKQVGRGKDSESTKKKKRQLSSPVPVLAGLVAG